MKQRFSSLDVKVIAHELNQCLTTLRVANIYDLSSKIILFKFSKPDTKKQLLIDIGFRCHTTDFTRATAGTPSAFTSRLRKFLKTRRLTSVSQIGTDRIIEFQFSDGQYRLFLEFFASGNVILADADLKILALSRNVAEGEGQEPQKIGSLYSLESRQNFSGVPDITQDRVRTALAAAAEKAAAIKSYNPRANPKQGDALRKCLAASITELPPILVDHILTANNFDSSVNLDAILENNSLLSSLTENLRKARNFVDSITSSSTCPGFIFAKRSTLGSTKVPHDAANTTHRGLLFDDFHPFIPNKFENDAATETLRIEGYNQTVDKFFSSLEGQRLENRLVEKEQAAQRKLDAAKQDQQNRIKGLQNVQYQNLRKAAAIEANPERVQEAMDSINGLLNQGMDWVDIGKLVEREKKKNNPVASIICLPLNLAENTIALRLNEEDEDESEEEDPFETDESDVDSEGAIDTTKNEQKHLDKRIIVEVILSLSPWSNARQYYDQRKTAVVKEEKTQVQADKAIKSTEKKIKQDLKRVLKQEKALLQPIRNLMWFEKFYWFISSDGYLVIGAKDKTQAEILYRRHLRSGDVYCHADAGDAAVVIIKNNANSTNAHIPPATLSQAGQLSVCSSEAWDSKAGIGSWWVNANQVSKSTPTGDLLQPGSFNIDGDKNHLPPGQLLLGLSILFKISEGSKINHTKHLIQGSHAAAITPERHVDMTSSHADNNVSGTFVLQDLPSSESCDEVEAKQDGDQDRSECPLQAPEQTDNTVRTAGKGTDEGHAELDIPCPHKMYETVEDIGYRGVTEPVADTGKTSTYVLNTPVSASKGIPESELKKSKRGQRRKAKKVASKYKDQDEEDRAAAEALVGAAIGKQKVESEARAKRQREEELERAKARRRAQHEKKQQEVAEHEEKRRAILNGVSLGVDDEEDDKELPIDVLVGTPRPGDEILEAITVCAPWAALGRCKYKVKMQPGPVKKGKAVKEALDRWKADSARKGALDEKSMDAEKIWPREAELIKSLKPEAMVNTVPAGKVRLMVVGGSSGGGKGGRSSAGSKIQGKGGKVTSE